MSKTNSTRPSRDGDQFHYLWAARRCVRLLSPRNDLVTISIEGPSPNEGVDEATAHAGANVIDVAEYYGHEDIGKARRVNYIQLKHSTRNPTTPWTPGREKTTLAGFAERYRALDRLWSGRRLAPIFEFWLVTNRPIGAHFAATVDDVAGNNQPRLQKTFNTLCEVTELPSDDLLQFLKLLRFSSKQPDYWHQDKLLFQDISTHLAGAAFDPAVRLKELVVSKASSQGSTDPTITKSDVLTALKTDERKVFPAKCSISTREPVVPREDDSRLLQQISSSRRPVIVHGSGGVGKTVFSARIADSLPHGSTCILYDCFGAGQYRHLLTYRHRHQDALVQIANELASETTSHLLLPTSDAQPADYLREFISRLNQAVALLRTSNPSARLYVVVDAADSAQLAAEEAGDARCFARDLIRVPVPVGVRFVFVCRTHRRNVLDPPATVLELEIRPFSAAETATRLRHRFAEATDQEVAEFHERTSHNPRVQGRALSRNQPLNQVLRALGQHQSAEDVIAGMLTDAMIALKGQVTGVEETQIDALCAGLAVLPPPIPIALLSRMSCVHESAIKSFAADFEEALVVAGDTLQFFDEPAETWFREQCAPSADAMGEFVASLRECISSSGYAALVLPQLLLATGGVSELVDLALTSEALPDTTALERQDIEVYRLQFALKASLRTRRYHAATKVALKAASETAGDTRQEHVVSVNADLAAAFLESSYIRQLTGRKAPHLGWPGSRYACDAVLLSGCRDLRGNAHSRLRMADDWLRLWGSTTRSEQAGARMSLPDLVNIVFARFELCGPGPCAEALKEWNRAVAFRVVRVFVRRLANHGRFEDVEAFGHAAGNQLCCLLAITVELQEVQRSPPEALAAKAFRLVASRGVRLGVGATLEDRAAVTGACVAVVRAGLHHGVCTAEEAAATLSRYLRMEEALDLRSATHEFRFHLLRAYCLWTALQGDVIGSDDQIDGRIGTALNVASGSVTGESAPGVREELGAVLPWHRLWAASVIGNMTSDALQAEIEHTIHRWRNSVILGDPGRGHIADEIAVVWLGTLRESDALDLDALARFGEWIDGLNASLSIDAVIALIRLCGGSEESRSTALTMAGEVYQRVEREIVNAESKCDTYIRLARAVLRISGADARAYFDKACAVATTIGTENMARWDAILHLAMQAQAAGTKSSESAYHLAQCAERSHEYLCEGEEFDWDATIEAMCGLCPAAGLAILSRWRDSGLGWPDRNLPVAVAGMIERGDVDPRDVLPLVGFRVDWSYESLVESVSRKCESNAEWVAARGYLDRYRPVGNRGDEWRDGGPARSGGPATSPRTDVSNEAIVPMDDMTEDVADRDGSHGGSVVPLRSSGKVYAGCDLTSVEGLSEAYAAAKVADGPGPRAPFFREAIQRVTAGDEPAFIEAVAKIPECELWNFEEFVKHVPAEWKSRPATADALTNTIKAVYRRYCMRIVKDRYHESLPFRIACTVAQMSESDMAGVVLDAVGEAPEFFDCDRMFSLVGLLAVKLSEEDAEESLKFGFQCYGRNGGDEEGDELRVKEVERPGDIRESLAGWIWAAMASPEGAMRWQGSHAVFGLFVLKRQKVLRHLFKLANEMRGAPFVDSKLPFYDLHALQWFVIGIARAVIEVPAEVGPFAGQIVAWALRGQRHVLIRRLAARAALGLIRSGMLTDEDNLKERLTEVQRLPLPPDRAKRCERIGSNGMGSAGADDDDQYYFDRDIRPYWYGPLGRVLNLSERDIATEALNVVRNEFGVTAMSRRNGDERSRRNLYKTWTGHSHGTYPLADTLEFYHAYHAMMIVAGKLLAEKSASCESESIADDGFEEWLNGHDLSQRDGYWLWDRRDRSPLGRPGWLDRKKDRDGRRMVTRNDCDEGVDAGSTLNVWGDWTVVDSAHVRVTRVYSAMVARENATEVIRRLCPATDIRHRAMPVGMRGMEIDDRELPLEGWIVVHDKDSKLDSQDPWAGNISFPPPEPAPDIVEMMGLVIDSDRRTWKDQNESTQMTACLWDQDGESDSHENEHVNCGGRLQASLEFMSELLGKLERNLIIQVRIGQRSRYGAHIGGTANEKVCTSTKVGFYLLKADGQVRPL